MTGTRNAESRLAGRAGVAGIPSTGLPVTEPKSGNNLSVDRDASM